MDGVDSINTVANAVRNYLLYLDDPQQLVDADKVRRLEQQAQQATDPLDRLVALAECDRERRPSEDHYRIGFVEHAQTWASEHGVPASAFEQVGVPTSVLREAGLISETGAARAGTSTTVEELKSAADRLTGPFTAKQLVDKAGGGSPMTVRKAITQLVDEGKLQRLGPDPNWTSRGRAPALFQRM